MTLSVDDYVPENPPGEVVHWMQPGPLRLEPPGVAVTAAAAFALGLAAAFAVTWLAPRREGLPPWSWRRGPVH